MPPPSQLSIATSSLNRLVKEEASYHKELEQQQASIAKLEQQGTEGGDENAEYTLRQERKALEETKALFPRMRSKIQEAFNKLEEQLEEDEDGASAEDVTKAKEAVAAALKALRESS